jgi:adenine-specific DNA-methyltransferase
LRRNQSDAEAWLWFHLRDRRLRSCRFRRQHQIGPYFADFACAERWLVVELDGAQHVDSSRYDADRTVYMRSAGWRVIRFRNDDVFLRTDDVLEAIITAVDRAPHPSPLHARGERELPK